MDCLVEKYIGELKKKKIERFDDVHIKSKNVTGMVYAIKGNKLVVKTIGGLVTADKNDVELVGIHETQKLDEIESPNTHVLLRKINLLNIEIRNQLKLDGYDKEADKIFLKASDLIKEIKKLYK